MENKPLVIGITGPFGSGKSTAAAFFEKKGFSKITLSQFLEDELIKNGKEVTRKNLQDLGNQWRSEKGSSAMAQAAIDYIKSKNIEKVVIDGIRNLGEIELFKIEFDFKLIGVVADRGIRLVRVKKMGRREDLNLKSFDELDYRDMGITEDLKTGLQVAKCLALSDFFIDSNHGYERFDQDLEDLYKNL